LKGRAKVRPPQTFRRNNGLTRSATGGAKPSKKVRRKTRRQLKSCCGDLQLETGAIFTAGDQIDRRALARVAKPRAGVCV
jgi:hypothetical protein